MIHSGFFCLSMCSKLNIAPNLVHMNLLSYFHASTPAKYGTGMGLDTRPGRRPAGHVGGAPEAVPPCPPPLVQSCRFASQRARLASEICIGALIPPGTHKSLRASSFHVCSSLCGTSAPLSGAYPLGGTRGKWRLTSVNRVVSHSVLTSVKPLERHTL